MILRPNQQRTLDQLYTWWMQRPGITETPIVVMPTGSGKSVVIAELCRLLFDTWPQEHPRTVVLVPSKELAEQNAAKLRAMLPSHLSVGYYSASLGRKVPHAGRLFYERRFGVSYDRFAALASPFADAYLPLHA